MPSTHAQTPQPTHASGHTTVETSVATKSPSALSALQQQQRAASNFQHPRSGVVEEASPSGRGMGPQGTVHGGLQGATVVFANGTAEQQQTLALQQQQYELRLRQQQQQQQAALQHRQQLQLQQQLAQAQAQKVQQQQQGAGMRLQQQMHQIHLQQVQLQQAQLQHAQLQQVQLQQQQQQAALQMQPNQMYDQQKAGAQYASELQVQVQQPAALITYQHNGQTYCMTQEQYRALVVAQQQQAQAQVPR